MQQRRGQGSEPQTENGAVQKHFPPNRAMKGHEHACSLEPVGLRKMIRDLSRLRMALGDGVKKPYPSEADAMQKMGKKIVAARGLPARQLLRGSPVAFKVSRGG